MTKDENESVTNTLPTKMCAKKSRKVFKFRFLSVTNLHTVRREQIFFYILSLHKKIRFLLRKCKRYREKIIKLVSMSMIIVVNELLIKISVILMDVDVLLKERTNRENDSSSVAKNSSSDKTNESKPTEVLAEANNFIADIKNAAHQAQNETGFIYEPTSGLYYDSRTGYYYNAVGFLLKNSIKKSANIAF